MSTICCLMCFCLAALSVFSGPCSRCSRCAKNRHNCCELAATHLTGRNANPSTGMLCDWTCSKGHKCAFFSNSIYEAWNNKHHIACILCDKTTAFDCTSHEALLPKLEHYRVTQIVLNWFRSYLHDTRQRVSLHCTATHCFKLDWESIKLWVHQGPMLFNIYVQMISQQLWINSHTPHYMLMTLIL